MDEILTPAEVGKRLTKSDQWVTAEARSGRLPGRKVGRTWRFTEADIQAYLEAAAVNGKPAPKPVTRRRRAA